ncbi:MAG: glycosyltransferase family 39 protein [Bryobacteraceae bacterium]|nr:glycosyltransferase family 39 protein [Bryobacteraceae bacterium]
MPSRKYDAVAATVLCAVVLLTGLPYLPFPLHGDQALFLQGAKQMAEGDRLYVDYWDLKPPGIFFWYSVAGSIFGYSETGLHAFDLLNTLAAAVLAFAAARRCAASSFAAAASGAVCGVTYFAIADARTLTQPEGVVLPALLMMLMACCRVGPTAWLISGVGGGIAFVFKPIFVVICAGLWLIAARRSARFMTACAWILAGAAIPVLATVVYFGSRASLGALFWTLFVYPRAYLADQPVAWGRAPELVLWMTASLTGVTLLALLGGHAAVRNRSPLLQPLAYWSLSAAVVILVQARSWWTYHILLLVPPLSVLAGLGIEWLVHKSGELGFRRRGAMLFLAICLAHPCIRIAQTWGLLLAHRGAIDTRSRSNFQARVHPESRVALRDVENLGGSTPLVIFGNPWLYLLTGRRQAISVSGWSPENWTAERWGVIVREIRDKKVEQVYVANSHAPFLDARVRNLLASSYSVQLLRSGQLYTRSAGD